MRIPSPYTVRQRPDSGAWQITLTASSGLPRTTWTHWQRKSFANFPPELARFREPTSRTKAEQGAQALIQHLRRTHSVGIASGGPTVGSWLNIFLDVATSPRAARLVGKNRAYSPDTIDGYASYYHLHLEGHAVMSVPMERIDQGDILELMQDVGEHQVREGRPPGADKDWKPTTERTLAGTRTFEAVFSFVRMTFREYQMAHPRWVNPFLSIERAKPVEGRAREGIDEQELARLFAPGIMATELERAVGAAMFWAGLRRSEIFALRPEDLDWKTPKINVTHAWKRFSRPDKRTLGKPKHDKIREAPFPDVLRKAIKDHWKVNGSHEYVMSDKEGEIPSARWFGYTVSKWFKKAGIDLDGRAITPHSARHSLASILEAQGVPLRYIQDILGHSDLKTTKGYLHSPSETINRITKQIEEKTKN